MHTDPQPDETGLELPWEQADFHGMKPEWAEWGFFETHGRGRLRRLRPRGCSQEELIARCEDLKASPIILVWTPDSPFIQNIREVPFLADAFVRRSRRSAWLGVKHAAIHLILWPALLWNALREEDAPFGDLELAMVCATLLFGIVPVVRGCATLVARAWRTTEGLRDAAATGRFIEWVNSSRAPATLTLCVMLLVVGCCQGFIAPSFDASIFQAGLLKENVRQGEHWRLLTGTLLHGGWAHLLMNTMALLALGRIVERIAGERTLSAILLPAALAGSLASQIFLPEIPSVGFSGAILGLLGFLLPLSRKKSGLLPWGFGRLLRIDAVFIATAGLILIGVFDNAAHFGGFGMGWLIGLLFARRHNGEVPIEPGRLTGMIGWVGYRALLVFAGLAFWKIC